MNEVAADFFKGDTFFLVNTGGVYKGLNADANLAGKALVEEWGGKKTICGVCPR